jgi:hypothetical protein
MTFQSSTPMSLPQQYMHYFFCATSGHFSGGACIVIPEKCPEVAQNSIALEVYKGIDDWNVPEHMSTDERNQTQGI